MSGFFVSEQNPCADKLICETNATTTIDLNLFHFILENVKIGQIVRHIIVTYWHMDVELHQYWAF